MRSKFRVLVAHVLVVSLILSQPLLGFATVNSFRENQTSSEETTSQNATNMLAPTSTETVAEVVYSSSPTIVVTSAPNVEATTIANLLPPSAPTNLKCVSKTDKAVTLSWAPFTDDGVNISGYSIYNETKLLAEDIKDTNYTISELASGTTYSFTVKAKDEFGNVSVDSSPLIITTLTIINSDTALFENKTIGDLYINNGAFNLNGYKLNVNGNVIISGGTLNVNGGQISISGDLILQTESRANDGSITYGISYGYLKMVNSNDRVLVGGGFVCNTRYSHNGYLTAGVLEVKGDLWERYPGYNTDNFYATGTHQVILSGIGLQTVTFDRPESKFNILTITKPLNTGYTFNRTPLWNTLIEEPEDDKAPSEPQELTLLSKSASTVTLSWGAATDNVGVSGYEIYRNGLKVWSTTSTSYTDTGLEPSRTYLYKVKAFDIAGNQSDFTNEISVVTDLDIEAPTIPRNLTITSKTSSSISLSWLGSSDNIRLAGYEIYRNDSMIAKTNGVSFVDLGLEEGTYTYMVKAFDSSNNYSDPSNSVVYDNQAPDAPVLSISSKTTTTVLLSWEATADNIGVTGYEIYRNGSKLNTTKLNSFNDTSLTPNTTYTYFIKAYDAAGNLSVESNSLEVDTVIDTQAPSVPNNLVIASRTGKSMTLKWSASTDNVSVKGYEVYRDGINIGNSSGTQYIDMDVTLDNVYIYSIKAYDSAGNKSEISAQVSGSPVLPHISKVIPSDKTTIGGNENRLILYFTNNDNFEGAYAKFEYSIDGEEWTNINNQVYGPNWNSSEASLYINWDLKDIKSGICYLRYTVYDATENSDSMTVLYQVDKTAPSAPNNLESSAGPGQVDIFWDASPEADVISYKVYRALETDGTYSKIADVSGRNSVSYTDINVTADKVYCYKVTAVDKFGQEGLASNIVCTLAGIDDVNPSVLGIVPLDGTIFGKSATILVRAEDNLQLKAIKLEYSTDDGKTWTDISSANTTNNATFHWDIPLITGEVKVRGLAIDSADNTSDGSPVRTYIIDQQGPAKVTGLTGNPASTSILLKWDDVPDNDFSYFQIERKDSIDGNYVKVGTVNDVLGMNVTNLNSNNTYWFRVVAYDKYGNRGIDSDEVKVITTPDKEAPQIKNIQPVPGYFKTQIPIIFTVSDNIGVKSLTIQTSTDHTNWNDVTTLKPSEIKKTANISYNLDISEADEGSIYVRGIALDEAGNSTKTTNDATYIEYVIDRTAPSQPTGLKAIPTAGNILLSWNKNAEQDLASYIVYRATSENGTYDIVSNKLSSLNYLDKDVVQGTVYYYKVSPLDHAGNEGPLTTSVSTMLLADEEAPVVLNMTKAADGVLPANPTIRVQAVDNYRLASIKLEYKYLDVANSDWKEVGTCSDLNIATQVVPFTWITKGLTDGNYSLRATAIDIDDNVSQPLLQNLKLNLQPPSKPVVSVEELGWKINLSWTKGNDSDLAGFKIYRSKNSGSSYQIIRQTTDTNYSDELLTPGRCYYYVIEAIDIYGNFIRSNEVSAIPTDEDKTNPLAEAGPDQFTAVGLGMLFDGTASSDNDKISSYHWDFGDGNTSTLAQPEHTYYTSGSYTVSLSVYDPAGNGSIDELRVVVNDLEKVGTIEIKVVDEATGQPLYNSSVYVELPDGTNCKKATDGQGICSIVGPAGNYKVYAYKTDYLPTSISSNVLIGQTTKATVKLKSGKIVVGVLSVDRMSLEQIRDAGIDTTNSDNQYVYKFKVRLGFSDKPIENEIITNGCGYIYGGQVTIHDPSGSGSVAYLTAIPHENHPEVSPTIAYMTIPGQATWQKEFFEVSLVIQNMAKSEFVLENSSVKLNKPSGLSIVKESNNSYAKSQYVNIGSIAGGQSKEVKWIIRGEIKGSYSLSADFNSTLMPFGDAVKATFVTTEPFRVWGDDALEMQIEGDDYAFAGDPYYIKVGLKNISDVPVNNVSLNLNSGENFTFVDDQKTSITAEKIAPGETLWNEYYLLPDKDGEDILHDVLLINMSDGINIKTTFKPIPAPLTGSVLFSSTAKATDVEGEYIIEVSLTAANRKGYTVKNAKASIGFEPSDEVEFVDCISQQDLGDIEPSSFGSYPKTVIWKIKIKPGTGENNYSYAIKLWGDNARERTISGILPNEYRIEDGKITKSTGIFYYQSKNEVEEDGKKIAKEQDYFSTYYYDDNYFSENASKYNPSLATMSLCFELSAWGSNVGGTRDYTRKYRNAEDLMGKTGFKNFEANDCFKEKPNEDSMGVVIASKEIEVNGKEYTLIALATRGGGYEAEWAGNFTVGKSGQHQGFTDACDVAYSFLEEYIESHKSEFKSNVKLWLAGYSRGGATVNLLAGRLVDEGQIGGITIEKEDLYAYCFEPPMGALQDQIVPVSKYTNIHNIVNPSDLVPKVAPRAWGFTRYGVDENKIPSKLNYSNFEKFKEMLEKFEKLDTQWVHESLIKVNDDENEEDEYIHIIDTFQAKKFNPNFRIDFGHWEEKTGVFGLKYWEYKPNFEIGEEFIINDDMTMSWFLDTFITTLALGIGDRVNYTEELQGPVRLAIAEFMGGRYESYKWDKAFDIFDKKVKDNVLDIAATYIWSGVPGAENLILEYLYKSISEAGIDLPAYGSIPNALTEALKAFAKTVVVSAGLNGGNDLLTLFSEGNLNKLMQAHYPELCLAWMQMQDTNYSPEGRELFIIDCYRILRINCPVDVSVYNSKGTLVAQFINDVPQKIKDSTIVSSFTSDGEKVVFLPADEDYDVRILATGEGKLNYSVSEFSNDTEAYAKIVNYYDVPIVAGDKLSGVVPRFSPEDIVNTGEGSQVKYALSSSAGELVSSKELIGKSAQEAVYAVGVESNNVEGGRVIGGGAYSEGAFAQVAAICYEKCEFVGWYENDTLISNDAVYRFQVKKAHSLIAKFNGNRPSPTSGTYPLKIEAGLGGSIIKGANGNYSDGSITPLKATPNSGYRFKQWISSNGGKFVNANGAITTFTMPANETTITAIFETTSDNNYALTITAGNGGTIITGTSGDYALGATINLVATPNSGYYFKKWISSNGGTFANVKDASTTFTMPANSTNITASFEYITPVAPGGGGNIVAPGGGGNNVVPSGGGTSVSPSTDVSWLTLQNQINRAKDGDSITFDMKNETTLPTSILITLKGKDVTIVLNMGINTWSINGKRVKEIPTDKTSYELKVSKITDSNLSKLANGKDLAIISLAQNVKYPFSATLEWNIGTAQKGNKIYLSYYNEKYKWLEYCAMSTTDSNGNVKFDINRNCNYLLTTEAVGVLDLSDLIGTIEEPEDFKVPGTVVLPKDIYVTKNLGTKIGGGLFSSVPYLIEKGESNLIKWSCIDGNTVAFLIPKDGIYEYRDNKKVFNDISGHWAENTITAITSREIFSGIGNLKFDPNGGMTRAMFATVLSRLDEADLSKYKTSPFTDVAINDWFGPSVAWASDKGILSGYGNRVFAPNECITREQMAVMLNNYLKYKGITLPSSDSVTSFADNDQVSIWAKDSVAEMKSKGIIQGSGNNNYSPKATANRASVAQILMNVINAVVVNSNK